jgi:DTW domain-containing protein YfiP
MEALEEADQQKHRRVIAEYLRLKERKFVSGYVNSPFMLSSKLRNRCHICFHSLQYCICKSLPAIHLSEHLQIIVYMDCKEVYNAGDDGKLLLAVLPNQSRRFIYGLDDEALVQHIGRTLCHPLFSLVTATTAPGQDDVVVLFPSSSALSFPEWMELRSAAPASSPLTSPTTAVLHPAPLTIIVVDAVWRHARRMAYRLLEILPHVRHVQLTPEQMSVYARKQSQPDRICTVEATALFLFQFGESESDTDGLVECVKINNLALQQPSLRGFKQKKKQRTEEGESDLLLSLAEKAAAESHLRHPAWYFGRAYCGEPTREFNPGEMLTTGTSTEEIARGSVFERES